MTITIRLLVFFLLTLGIVLASFSAVIYSIERANLLRQFDSNQNAIMDIITSAVEEKPDGLEWEPNHRDLFQQSGGKPTIWAVFNENMRIIDGSNNYPFAIEDHVQNTDDRALVQTDFTDRGRHWRLAQKTLHFSNIKAVNTDQPLSSRHLALTIIQLTDTTPIYNQLHNLAWTMATTSLIVWMIAAILGRWLCRRALRPLTDVCEAVQNIAVDDLGERLSVPSPRDELNELTRSFNDLLSRLQEAFERQKQFTGHASHQLRTPLAGILGQVEVALIRDREPQEYRAVLSAIQERGIHLKAIIDTLLFLSRADAEANHPELEPVDLGKWLQDHIHASWSNFPEYSNFNIQLENDKSIYVQTHPVLLGQAIDTLIDNAIKYSHPNTPITIRLSSDLKLASIQIINRGIGISQEDRQNIFLPFFRSSEVRQSGIPGVGLGLSIVNRIVQSLGGSISVDSQPDRETTFTIAFSIISEDKI